jgi:hypothetical protein
MRITLSELVRSSNDFSFSDPLFQIVDFTVQHEQLQGVVELGAAFGRQISKSGIKLVDLIKRKFQ